MTSGSRRSHPERAPSLGRAPEPLTWEQLVRVLLGHARRLGASVEEAEDLVQETVERTVRDPAWHDPARGAIATLLRTVLQRRWIDRHRAVLVRDRAAPQLRLVAAVEGDACAGDHRALFLAHLTSEERRLFEVWLRQRHGELDVYGAGAALGLSASAYEAAKKRLRRRCHTLLDELGLSAADLFDGGEA